MTQENKILAKVKKLLAKAEGTDNPHEAEAFFVAAQKLIAEHRISQAELDAVDQKGDEIGANEVSAFEFRLEGEWETQLAHVIIRTNGCEFMRCKDDKRIEIFGTTEDVMLVKFLFETTRDTFRRLSKVMWRNNKDSEFTKKNQYIRSFLLGACAGLKEKITRMTAEVVQETGASQYALVLANKVERARAYVIEHRNVRFSKSRTKVGSDSAFGDGREVGRNHQLSRPLYGGNGSSTKLLS